jgi:hypothetical protein
MKQNKLVLVVLVVIVVLFVVGLSMGLFHGDEEHENGMTMDQAQSESQKDGWIASLNDKMSSFRTPLDRGRLPDKAICPQPPGPDLGIVLGRDGSIKLDNELECSIKIAASKDDEDLESAILTVGGNDAALIVAYPGIGACPKSRGVGVSLKKFKTPKVAASIGKIKQPKAQQGLTPPKFELIVAYIPADNEKVDGKYCTAVEKVHLAVLKKGGTIKMKCTGCNRQKKKTIHVKLE